MFPRFGGWSGTHLTVPPGISMFAIYLIPHQPTSPRLWWGCLLVEVWFKDDDLISGLDKGHEGTEHALISSCGDNDLGLRI